MTAEEAMKLFDRHGLTGRVPYLDVRVAEALKRVEAERDAARAEADRLAEALTRAASEQSQMDALLAGARSTVGAAVHELEVGEASDFLDGTISTPRRQAEEYKRAAADLTWVRVSLRELLRELATQEETPTP